MTRTELQTVVVLDEELNTLLGVQKGGTGVIVGVTIARESASRGGFEYNGVVYEVQDINGSWTVVDRRKASMYDQEVMNWFLAYAPKGSNITSVYHSNPDPENTSAQRKVVTAILTRIVNDIIVTNDINVPLARLEFGTLDEHHHLCLFIRSCSAQYIAEKLGLLIWNDEHAYRWHQM